MKTVIVTGVAGWIGSESAKSCAREGLRMPGSNHDLRQWFFGQDACALGNRRPRIPTIPKDEQHGKPDGKPRDLRGVK